MHEPRITRGDVYPPPPGATGTAEYARELIGELEKLVNLQVFESVPKRVNWKAFDAVIYQIANNPHHAAFYERALDHPGIAVLHEVNLHDLIKGQTLNRGGERAYLNEVMYEVFGQDIGDPDRGGLFDVPQPRTFTMLRRLLDHSERCIVHSGYAERGLRAKGFRKPVAAIPHGSSVRSLDARPYRKALGVEPNAPLIGLFGYQRPDKRELECFRTFERLLGSYPSAHLLIAGEPHPEVPVKEWILQSGLERQVHMLGFQKMEDYDGCLAACDIILNLRHPTFGETSGTMMRAFGLAKTVIVSDAGASRELPDDVCIRIPPDGYEKTVLVECMKWLLESPSRMEEIGSRAQQWVGDRCTWPKVAGMYAAFAKAAADGVEANLHRPRSSAPDAGATGNPGLTPEAIGAYLRRWIDPAVESADYFRTHSLRLAHTLQRVPLGGAEDRVLEMGCYLQITPALRNLLGYGEVRGAYLGNSGEVVKGSVVATDGEAFECFIDLFNAELNPFPYQDEYFSTVLCCELLEHLEHDPMHMMSEIYRILKPGGVLLLTTPNIASLRAIGQVLRGAHPASFRRYTRIKPGGRAEPGHSREYTPDEIRLLLADSGFIVLSVETGPYGETALEDPRWVLPVLENLNRPTALRGDCIFAAGRRESLPRKRFPVWLYGE
ncbi:MAG: methyltransferase domain-containing protein [Acidobacteriia bacterium]|nr:methyltransferase domain-containing protein [Terriglobia bacterium]